MLRSVKEQEAAHRAEQRRQRKKEVLRAVLHNRRMQDMSFDQILSPRTWEDQCDDSQLTIVNETNNPLLEEIDIDAELESFGFDEDDAGVFDFLAELDPVEAAEARALVAELEEAAKDADPAGGSIDAQSHVLDTFQMFAPMNRNNKRRAIEAVAVTAVNAEEADYDTDSQDGKRARVAVTAVPISSMTSAPAKAGATGRAAKGPQRTVPWRRRGSPENERMRGAVWVYRFAPRVRSKAVQQHFGVAVKSLMRYVYDSCEPEFEQYGLYFGPAGMGPAGKADRALKRGNRVSPGMLGYVVDQSTPGVPIAAKTFLDSIGTR